MANQFCHGGSEHGEEEGYYNILLSSGHQTLSEIFFSIHQLVTSEIPT